MEIFVLAMEGILSDNRFSVHAINEELTTTKAVDYIASLIQPGQRYKALNDITDWIGLY